VSQHIDKKSSKFIFRCNLCRQFWLTENDGHDWRPLVDPTTLMGMGT
jgi:hypothetical protein